jgi:D-glycero-alpha-D-manno-heptose-7-phosphate kinase
LKIKIESPTRVDFAGGTLDCWPLHTFVKSAVTINLSISIYSTVELKPSKDLAVNVNIKDLQKKMSFTTVEEFLNNSDPGLVLVQTAVRFFNPKKGFDLTTASQSPVGAGLGGSSSLMIGLIKAFLKMQKKKLSPEQMVHLAHNLEARILKTPTGTQDYVPAISPGLFCLHYFDDKMKIEKLKVNRAQMLEHFSLIYTGRAHHSGMNNWSVIKAAVEGDVKTIRCLNELADVSNDMLSLLKANKWDGLGELFRRETEVRLRLAPAFLSPEILEIDKFVKTLPNSSMKVCGAGGGGCVFVWSKKKKDIKAFCESKGFHYLDAKPVI